MNRRRAAFTLVEALIAVAALALIAVGISQVFRATGETIKGGKRLSNLNTLAAAIERQFREDFSRITRDGFLVIRNEQARDQSGNDPELFPGDTNTRPRRVDEIMFFATGEYRTLRPAVTPRRNASAQAARIYIGHGLRWDPSDPAYRQEIDLDWHSVDGNSPNPPPTFGRPGPNQYASDWILMRHATLLTRPRSAMLAYTGVDLRKQPDNDNQISQQPAARTIFRSWNDELTPLATPVIFRPVVPAFDCGVVDIAATDLTEIRSFLHSAAEWGMPAQFDLNWLNAPPRTFPRGPVAGEPSITRMQAWMRNAFPTDSDAGRTAGSGGRMRVEPTPPNPLGFAGNDLLRGDHQTLSSFNLAPACSDFIVEWSFGNIYTTGPRTGQLVWHGMRRDIDPDGDGTRDEIVAHPYGDPSLTPLAQWGYPRPQQFIRKDGSRGEFNVTGKLIHFGPNGAAAPPPDVLYSYFGCIHPEYTPTAHPQNPDSIAWPWPRLIRITMTLADPAEPSFEQTFQFIFKLPEEEGDGRY